MGQGQICWEIRAIINFLYDPTHEKDNEHKPCTDKGLSTSSDVFSNMYMNYDLYVSTIGKIWENHNPY